MMTPDSDLRAALDKLVGSFWPLDNTVEPALVIEAVEALAAAPEASETAPLTGGIPMTTLDDRIAELEHRVLNAGTLQASARFHTELDQLRSQRERADSAAYERGYQAGYHAAQRLAWKNAHPECNHEGIGYPWCETCGPRTRRLLREQGVDWPE